VQSVNNGAVLLGGKAQTMSDHLRAIEIARGVPGVRKVESEIESPDRLADDEIRRNEPSKTEATRSMGAAAKDMTITADTKMRLLADSDVPALDVNVDTFNGTVTLWGSVPTQQAKAAAEADARKVGGVTRVMNELSERHACQHGRPLSGSAGPEEPSGPAPCRSRQDVEILLRAPLRLFLAPAVALAQLAEEFVSTLLVRSRAVPS